MRVVWRGRVAGGPCCRMVEFGARKAHEELAWGWSVSADAPAWQLCRDSSKVAGVGWLGRTAGPGAGVPAA